MDAAERMLRWWDEHSDPRVEIGCELRPLGPCKCGEVQIPSHFRRVLAGDVAHRRHRCGAFTALENDLAYGEWDGLWA